MRSQKTEMLSPQARLWAGVRPAHRVRVALVAKVLGAVLATALAAQVRVWVPGSPVPITLQTLVVLLAGFALGVRWAPVAMLLYLALGAVGLPCFAMGLFGPTGGYLVGFVFGAALVGRLGESGRGSWRRTAAVASAGTAVIFACGVAWLTVWLEGDFSAALQTGLVPFVLGDMLKTAMAVVAVRAWRLTVTGLTSR